MPFPLIGWRESVALPLLEIKALIAKIDTGARTAALHADNISIIGKKVSFYLSGRSHTLAIKGVRQVRSSSGQTEKRAIVETLIAIGQSVFLAEISLTDRSDMGVPMLLGRATIRGHYLVHPGRSYLLTKRPRSS